MKNIFITICISMFYVLAFGQNLIPNPSFEEENVCKVYLENCAPKAWRSTTLKAFLYHNYQISRQDKKVVKPADGNRCAVLRLFNTHRKLDRSFVQTPFLCRLEKGKKYKLQFQFTSPSYFVNSFEILLVDSIFITKKDTRLFDKKPQIKFEFTEAFSPKEWITLETIFEATGDEVGMIIGNFKRDENTKITLLKKKKRKDYEVRRVYHYFDNFSLEAVNGLHSDCDLEKMQQYIYKDSVRHIILSAPHSVQNFPSPSVAKLKVEITFPKENLVEIDTLENDKFIAEKPFTLANILFETNSDRLLPIAYNSLDELVLFFKNNQNFKLKITGHTDSQGNENHNKLLSKKRASSVANYLINNGLHQSKITTQGKGASEAAATNETSEGRKMNRRVEFELIKQ